MNSMYGAQAYGGPTGPKPGMGSTGLMKDKIPKGYKLGQLQQFSPEQMQLFQSLFGQLGSESPLGQLAGGDESAFGDIEAPAMRQFNELLGGLSSRFSGQGMGGRRSSGFQNATTAASSNFAQDLQSNRQNLQRQALMDLFGMSNMLLGQRPNEKFLTEKPRKWWEGPASGFAQGAGQGASAALFA